ncbi:hypothetical protein T06_6146 [Trichinella sp. T6]|nr:hypothetical protein T06_6146 [Trichinella sp. T6]
MKQLIFIFLPPAKITAGNVAAVLVAAVSFWMTYFVDPGKHPIGPEHLYRSIGLSLAKVNEICHMSKGGCLNEKKLIT